MRPNLPSPRSLPRLGFALGNAGAALLIAFGVALGLPARWAPVDVGAGVLVVLFGASAIGLFGQTAWSRTCARVTSAIALALGLALTLVLAVTASWLAGIYGPVGRGGAIILVLVAALVVPYLVVFPAAQLVWLDPRRPREAGVPGRHAT